MNNLLVLKLQKKYNYFFNYLSYFEDFLINNKQTKDFNLSKCIFISGMPRSGTTVLTHILSKFDNVGGYNYSDLPFYKIPYFWSKFKNLYYLNRKSLSRPHGDGLKIDISSPDAFEELIWSENLTNYKSESFFKFLNEDYENATLEKELLRNANKILKIRKKNIYLSKGNYNIFRIRYINNIFKNSFFVICIRNPVDVIKSSIKTHKQFLEINEKNKFFSDEMTELCHFEFGKNRKNISNDNKYVDDYTYYLNQWKIIHQLIYEKYLNLKNVFLFNFDNFSSNPEKSIFDLSNKLNLKNNDEVSSYVKFNIKTKDKSESQINDESINNLYQKLLDHTVN